MRIRSWQNQRGLFVPGRKLQGRCIGKQRKDQIFERNDANAQLHKLAVGQLGNGGRIAGTSRAFLRSAWTSTANMQRTEVAEL